MPPPKLGHVLKMAVKAPRDQLDRCAFLMKLCMEAKKAANSAEDGTKPATMTAADAFVDKACKYVTDLAEATTDITDVTASATEQKWESVKLATTEVLKVLPSNVSTPMEAELQEAEVNSKKAGTKMKEIIKVMGKGSKKSTVKLYFVCGPSGVVRGEDYEIQRCTQPSGLATIVLYRKREGCLPNFYLTYPGADPIDATPANWGPKDPTPAELYVVMDRGRFEFRFRIHMYSPITETWVFRNLFKLRELLYLKDSGGKLHLAPNGDLTFDNVVHCTKIQRLDRKRIAGPYTCIQWGDALEYIGADSDADWIVETEKKDEQPRSPSSRYTTSLIPTTSPSLAAIRRNTSRTLSIASTPPIFSGPIFASPTASMSSLAPSPPPPPHTRSPTKVPSSLDTTASGVGVTIPLAALPPTSPLFSPIVPPTALPVIQQAVPPTINSAVLSILPHMVSSAVPLAVPVVSGQPIISSTVATPSNQPKGGVFGRAVRWTKRTLGM